MPIQYLLPCSCGRKTPVETRQAGETIVCQCGTKLDVPRLIELKKLEKVAVQAGTTKKPSAWGIGHKLLLSGIVVLIGVAVLWWVALIASPRDASDDINPEMVRAHYQKMSPLNTWVWWTYFRDNGINPRKDRFERYMEGKFAEGQMWIKYLVVLAAAGATLVVAGAIVIRQKRPPRSKPVTT